MSVPVHITARVYRFWNSLLHEARVRRPQANSPHHPSRSCPMRTTICPYQERPWPCPSWVGVSTEYGKQVFSTTHMVFPDASSDFPVVLSAMDWVVDLSESEPTLLWNHSVIANSENIKRHLPSDGITSAADRFAHLVGSGLLRVRCHLLLNLGVS